MKLMSNNEWDQLRVVVLGTVERYAPSLEAAVKISDATMAAASIEIARAYPDWYMEEVAEDLEDFSAALRTAGVQVLRPAWTEDSATFSTPNWSASGHDLYNVRDLQMVVGNTLITGAPSHRFRFFENYGLQELFYDHFFESGFRWICAPMPRLKGEFLFEATRPLSSLEKTEDELHKALSHGVVERFRMLDEREIRFDAANVIRLNDDILYLVSNTGNRKAARWLQEVLGSSYRVHLTETYRSSHLDSTIVPLCEGKVVLNGARVSEATCPAVFASWDRMYFTDCEPIPAEEIEFHQTVRLPTFHRLAEMGIHSRIEHLTSPWTGLNMLVINPDTVMVHDRQVKLIRQLEARKFTVIPVRMRHSYTMFGGLHCTTLDAVRG